MITIKCLACGKELTSYTIETKCCGCVNMTSVTGNTFTGEDLSLVEVVSQDKYSSSDNGVLSNDDKQFQENRRQRKIRRINFETR
tara:strand:+ start:512 stop:766 length:255 start_codon:yes stop_codon:yes gene_type:complete